MQYKFAYASLSGSVEVVSKVKSPLDRLIEERVAVFLMPIASTFKLD